MSPNTLSQLFGIIHKTVTVNTEGLTHADSLTQPPGGGNCANWVLGHMVANRNVVMELLGEPAVWDENQSALYRRGSKAIVCDSDALPFDEILQDYYRAQAALMACLERKTEEDLGVPAGDSTVGEQLAFLQFHETYHAGQLGLLRRALGRPGAIE